MAVITHNPVIVVTSKTKDGVNVLTHRKFELLRFVFLYVFCIFYQ